MRKGYVGIVLIKVGIMESYSSTNIWPVVIMSCTKEKCQNVKDVIQYNIFNDRCTFEKYCIMHKKENGIPKELLTLGNIKNLEDINIIDNQPLALGWQVLAGSLYRNIGKWEK